MPSDKALLRSFEPFDRNGMVAAYGPVGATEIYWVEEIDGRISSSEFDLETELQFEAGDINDDGCPDIIVANGPTLWVKLSTSACDALTVRAQMLTLRASNRTVETVVIDL